MKILLTPGAGSGRDHSTLLALDAALDSDTVDRMDFPYRKEGRKAPDRAPKLMAAIDAELDELLDPSDDASAQLVMGGRSMGGRICSMVTADGQPTAGLVLISYPLHPPGKPEKSRIEHLPDIACPVLFVSGTRDAFGTPDELRAAAELVAGTVTLHLIDGGRHELKGVDEEICSVVTDFVDGLRG
jgi:predicted alpha/beta-hydrolase family hydrolase